MVLYFMARKGGEGGNETRGVTVHLLAGFMMGWVRFALRARLCTASLGPDPKLHVSGIVPLCPGAPASRDAPPGLYLIL